MNAIRAIYENGMLRLLDPVELEEGQRVDVVLHLKTEQELVREALKDLNIQWHNPNAFADDDIDEKALMKEIRDTFSGDPPLSQYIIEDRGET
jgi:predicted DNA-binding antitoxin AbrB/MazE fold protein